MKRSENNKWLDKALGEVIGSEESEANFEKWKQDHPEAVEMLISRASRQTSATQHPLPMWRIAMKGRVTKLAVAAVIVIAVFIGINQFGTNGSSVLWADVTERFESVPFVHMIIYLGSDTSTEAEKREIWMSEDSRIRVQYKDKVDFVDLSKKEGKVMTFDRLTKELKEKESDGDAPEGLTQFCKDGRFSLDTFINILPLEVKGITPVETVRTAASRETVFFEAKDETTGGRLTIWALRESKLPIRACFHDPGRNRYGDILFDYSEQKDAAFFDPEAFRNQQTDGEDKQ
jgi:hypothetical protein